MNGSWPASPRRIVLQRTWRWLALLGACCFWLAAALPALAAQAAPAAEKKLALVVGNARYPASPLNNPENDARVVASTLRRLGFEVTEHVNLPMKEFRRVLRDFSRRLQSEGAVAVFYYAGHGVQIDGRNFLLPVDLNLRDEDEVKDEGVDIDELLVSRLERARAQVRIVILDACRDNPFGGKTRTVRASTGLAEMAARGALIAYSSAPGATAEDGPPGTNSVYTRHLVKEMLVEGIEVEQMFKQVRVKVLRDTNQRQVPWVNTSLTANFSFNPRPRADDEVGRRLDLARLQDLLDQREREQKQLEEQLRQLSRRLEQASGVAVSAPATTPATAPTRAEAPAPSPAPAEANEPAKAAAVEPTPPPTRPTAAPASASPTSPPAVAAVPREDAGTKPKPRVDAKPTPAKPEGPTPTVAARVERSRPKPASTESPPAASPAKAVAGGARPAAGSERCVALLIRAQLGEPLSPADMDYLRKEC
ncbi:MAG: caspase family protein [Gammaproteobacteria bacterium]